MTIAIAIYGTLGAIWVLFLAACLMITPAGCHNRPPWWQRARDRRQHERAQDALNLRLIHDIGEGLRREATGPLTSSGMPAADAFHPPLPVDGWDGGPLMPLPPEVMEHADEVLSRLPVGTLESVSDQVCTQCGERWGDDPECECACTRSLAEPEDPHDVATPETEADAYVGGVRHDPEMDYRDETGTWPALMAEVAAEVTQ
jgi:hypothetical protein